MPLLTHRGQLEASASVQLNGRLEGSVVYSPLQYTLLSVGGTFCPKLGDSTYLTTRQYEVAAGGYYPLGASWLVSSLIGYGQAQSTRGYSDLAFPFGSSYSEYSAHYDKRFVQIGIAGKISRARIGFTYRLTQVQFASLTGSRLGSLPLTTMLRHESLVFGRYCWPRTSVRWALQVAGGLSMSSTPRLGDNQSNPDYGARAYHANRNLLPAFYTSLGVVYQPHW